MKASLDSLSVARQESNTKKKRSPAWLIPAGIIAGFALLFLALFRDRLIPAPAVTVTPVLTTPETRSLNSDNPTNTHATDGKVAFQASGWVEPDPLPMKATALTDGVIKEVNVLEGESVKAGQTLATLIQEDAQLALDTARQVLQTRQAELAAHADKIDAANRKVASANAEMQSREEMVAETADRLERVEKLATGVIAEADLVSIRSTHRRAVAAKAAATAFYEQAKAEVKQLEAQTKVLTSLEKTAQVEVEKAELAFSRTTIVSPANGRVLRLLASPGQKKMLGMDDPDSATIAILYDPENLQVRVDVPLADAAGLQIGQQTKIRCSLLPDTVFNGEVTRITGEADLQRNTLQAKVRIHNPSDQLRPEMLCRVEFLGSVRSGVTAGDSNSGTLSTWIPETAIQGEWVFICDPDTEHLEKRKVVSGNDSRDGFLLISEGLRPGEWVVIEPGDLKDGQRINPKISTP